MIQRIKKVLTLIKNSVKGFIVPSVTRISLDKDPYLILISCILSLRTKDKTTVEASMRLFKIANTPRKMIKLSSSCIQKLIYPVGFYRNKAKVILDISRRIIKDFGGCVPRNLEGLLSLKGVGRKTANLVLGLGFGITAICVDTHVHRVTNRLGWVKTKTPKDTEYALQEIIPKSCWIDLNTILVTFGQNICVPVSPWCSRCAVEKYCKKIEVTHFR